jgi:hypothetical protein
MFRHCATECPRLNSDFPPSQSVLHRQLPSLIVPYCASALGTMQKVTPNRIIASPKHFIGSSTAFALVPPQADAL